MMTHRLPVESTLYPDSAQYPYADAFTIPLHRTNLETWALIPAFFQSVPAWVGSLFMLRNQIVRHFGLQTGCTNRLYLTPPFQVGRKIGLFRLLVLTDYEVVMSEDDRHLDFRISPLLIRGEICSQLVVSTLVKTILHGLKAMARKLDQAATPKNPSDAC